MLNIIFHRNMFYYLLGLVDISRKNLSFYGQSKRSIHALNAVINSTLASVEVGHFDEHRLRNLVNTQGNGLKMLRDTDTIRVTYFNAERGTKWREQVSTTSNILTV